MADPLIPAKGGFIKNLVNSMGLKLIIILILILLFLIPVALLLDLVRERSNRQQTVQNEIVDLWGGLGQLAGPFLTIQYSYPVEIYNSARNKNETEWRTDQYILLPQDYRIDGELKVEELKRGIFSVPVFTADLNIAGNFATNEALLYLKQRGYRVTGAEVVLCLGNNRGIGSLSDLNWNGQGYAFKAGSQSVNLFGGTISTVIPADQLVETIPFSLTLGLKGGKSLHFLPIGQETLVRLQSTWPSPSFNGAFLPEKRSHGEEGFDAEWRMNHISRNSPGAYPSGGLTYSSPGVSGLLESSFGLQLFQAVDHYTRNERAVKYALLFIIIPFVAFFLCEIIMRKRVHPFQYLLSGSASIVFYLLLLSLSEHVGFNLAYMIAAGAVTAVMSFYAPSVLGDRKKGLIMLPLQICSWVYLFFALQSEDYALLIGSTGLFLILVLVMFITRKVRWYRD